jgi:predicted O-methyltransferase YrrM
MKAQLHAMGLTTKRIRRIFGSRLVEILLLPLLLIAALMMLYVRLIGMKQLKIAKWLFLKIGVMPIRNHYYEPLIDVRLLKNAHGIARTLPGIEWNMEAQLQQLRRFVYAHEMRSIPQGGNEGDASFYFGNDAFDAGDAEYWYQLIRSVKPRRIIEVGSGHSTKMARLAIEANAREDASYSCIHRCIEPYEMPWLEQLGVDVIRRRVEEVDFAIFEDLGENDILFIDSSHMIRPQGDVLFEYLELLPRLAPGVIVHIHDIFSPFDYPDWMTEDMLLWNEQYLLEAFLTQNPHWEVVGALHLLHARYFSELHKVCPRLLSVHQPGSFYIRRKLH